MEVLDGPVLYDFLDRQGEEIVQLLECLRSGLRGVGPVNGLILDCDDGVELGEISHLVAPSSSTNFRSISISHRAASHG